MSTSLVAAPFVAGLAEGKILVQRCADCGQSQKLARYACTACGQPSLAWGPAAGTGTVFAITLVSRPPEEAFRSLVPYALALVDLDDGGRLMGHAPAELRIGERVRAEVFEFAGRHLVRFERA